jgi:hypothetical protein
MEGKGGEMNESTTVLRPLREFLSIKDEKELLAYIERACREMRIGFDPMILASKDLFYAFIAKHATWECLVLNKKYGSS